jgi:dTMP kinase
MLKKSGFFVTFEGPDMTGKSTQIQLVSEILTQKGYKITQTFDPGGTEIAQKIREIIKNYAGDMVLTTELLLFCAARAEIVHKVIIPSLERGDIVLCDRFIDSTLIYQGYVRGWNEGVINSLHSIVCSTPKTYGKIFGIYPDLTFIFTGQQFKYKENKDFYDKDVEFNKKVIEGYNKLSKSRYIKINSDLDKNEIAKFIAETIINKIEE